MNTYSGRILLSKGAVFQSMGDSPGFLLPRDGSKFASCRFVKWLCRCVCVKQLVLREPLPCSPSAETALQPSIWCLESLSAQESFSCGGVFFHIRTHTHTVVWTTARESGDRQGPGHTLYVMLCYVMICYVIIYHVMLRYLTLLYVTLRYVRTCYIMLCYIITCHVMSCHVTR